MCWLQDRVIALDERGRTATSEDIAHLIAAVRGFRPPGFSVQHGSGTALHDDKDTRLCSSAVCRDRRAMLAPPASCAASAVPSASHRCCANSAEADLDCSLSSIPEYSFDTIDTKNARSGGD